MALPNRKDFLPARPYCSCSPYVWPPRCRIHGVDIISQVRAESKKAEPKYVPCEHRHPEGDE